MPDTPQNYSRFNVGDRVRLTEDVPDKYFHIPQNATGTITEVDHDAEQIAITFDVEVKGLTMDDGLRVNTFYVTDTDEIGSEIMATIEKIEPITEGDPVVFQRDRRAMLEQVAQFFNLEPERNTSAAEDYADYMEGRQIIEQWAAITDGFSDGGTVVYIKADHADKETAQGATLEHIADDIFPEGPVAVADLDTGEIFYPKWSELPWFWGERLSA